MTDFTNTPSIIDGACNTNTGGNWPRASPCLVWSRYLLKLRIGLYLALGSLIIAWARPVSDGLGLSGTGFLVSGLLAYSSGVIFYLWERLPFNQAVWHLFVITGSVCLFAAIAFYILPAHAV